MLKRLLGSGRLGLAAVVTVLGMSAPALAQTGGFTPTGGPSGSRSTSTTTRPTPSTTGTTATTGTTSTTPTTGTTSTTSSTSTTGLDLLQTNAWSEIGQLAALIADEYQLQFTTQTEEVFFVLLIAEIYFAFKAQQGQGPGGMGGPPPSTNTLP